MLDPGVITCSRCLQANWLPAGLARDDVACTQCGTNLLTGKAPAGISESTSASTARPRR